MPNNQRSMNRRYSLTCHAALVLALSLATLHATAQPRRPAPAPAGCGESRNTYGPFDYRTANAQQRGIVETAHFTRGVETLTKGATGPFGGDIGYTLAVFPNHHRAISAMQRLAEKEKADPPNAAEMSVECYYARGMDFAPDDLVFRMLFVNWLIRRNRLDDAHKFLDYVVSQAGDSPLTQFNAGMLYFDMKDYDKALVQAHRAISMGVNRNELRDRLNSVSRWQEPDPASAPDVAASKPLP